MAEQAPINEKPPYPDTTPPYPTSGPSNPPMPQPEGALPPPYPAQGVPPPAGGYQNTQPPPGYFSGQSPQVAPSGVPVQQAGYPVAAPAAIIVGARWSEVPQLATCSTCNEQVMTSVAYVAGSMTWLLCFIIVIFCGWLFCLCLIPFCMDGCKDVIHSCPNCNRNLGVYKRG